MRYYPPKDKSSGMSPNSNDQLLLLTDANDQLVKGIARYFVLDGDEQLTVTIELDNTYDSNQIVAAYLHTGPSELYELSGFREGYSRTPLEVNTEPDENWVVKVHFREQ
jgi:hypothetical protein